MKKTPRGERLHISIFGKTNVGKSTLLNSITNGEYSIVSPISGTTTDPVYKSMEILPIGPVVIIDTAGYDDTTILGVLRAKKTFKIIEKTDLAIIVANEFSTHDLEMLKILKEKNKKIICVINQKDDDRDIQEKEELNISEIQETYNIPFLKINILKDILPIKEEIIKIYSSISKNKTIIQQFINPLDIVVLVTPIDKGAPKGRLILPQQQVIREILDKNAISIVTQDTELKSVLNKVGKNKIKMVITDAQVFDKVAEIVPKEIPLTSFSILFANYKGELKQLVDGANFINKLKSGMNVLICEACSHHNQVWSKNNNPNDKGGDIGREKIPRLLQKKALELKFEWYSGSNFPDDLKSFDLIVHCGACMINEAQMKARLEKAAKYGIPIVNYGVLFAFFSDSLKRALEPFNKIGTIPSSEA